MGLGLGVGVGVGLGLGLGLGLELPSGAAGRKAEAVRPEEVSEGPRLAGAPG